MRRMKALLHRFISWMVPTAEAEQAGTKGQKLHLGFPNECLGPKYLGHIPTLPQAF